MSASLAALAPRDCNAGPIMGPRPLGDAPCDAIGRGHEDSRTMMTQMPVIVPRLWISAAGIAIALAAVLVFVVAL